MIVLSHGLHYASAVFEGERVYDSQVFKVKEHGQRLSRSAEMLDFTIPYSPEVLDEAVKELVAAQKVVNGYVRRVAWRGSEMMAISQVPPPISTIMLPAGS
jgi:branched-chain amino acid aminotransferase